MREGHETSGLNEPLMLDINGRDTEFVYQGLGGRLLEKDGNYWVQVAETTYLIPGADRSPQDAVLAAVNSYTGESEERFYNYGG